MTFTSEDLLEDKINTIITNYAMKCLIAIKSALPIQVATPHKYHYLNGARPPPVSLLDVRQLQGIEHMNPTPNHNPAGN